MRTKTAQADFRLKAEDGLQDGEFIVYPSTFIKEPDSYGDVVAPGAFKDTIARWAELGKKGLKLPGLYGHRLDDPEYNVAEAIEMSEDEHGWRVKGRFDLENPKARYVYRLVKGGRLSQLSFAYNTLDEGSIELEDGRKANELRKLDVLEFSFVPMGANTDTSIEAVKSAAVAAAYGLKAGESLSKDSFKSLRQAYDLLGSVLDKSEEEDGESSTAEGKTSGDADVKSGAPDDSKSASSSVENQDAGSLYLRLMQAI